MDNKNNGFTLNIENLSNGSIVHVIEENINIPNGTYVAKNTEDLSKIIANHIQERCCGIGWEFKIKVEILKE